MKTIKKGKADVIFTVPYMGICCKNIKGVDVHVSARGQSFGQLEIGGVDYPAFINGEAQAKLNLSLATQGGSDLCDINQGNNSIEFRFSDGDIIKMDNFSFSKAEKNIYVGGCDCTINCVLTDYSHIEL